MQKTNHQKIGSIVEHFKNQFDAVAFGFYKKLNSLCENYFDIDALTETPLIHNIKFPITDLDAPIHQQQPKAQLDSADQQEKKQGVASLSDAECIIKHIKWLYKHNINTQELHPSIHETTKKLYLPLINYAISNPTHYIQADNQFKLTTFIATLSRFHRHYDDNTLYQVQQLINHFIEAVLNQEASIESTHIKLLALTDKHILTAELINNNLPAAISQSKVDANPEPVLPTLDTELKNQLKPCIQEQAASIIAAIDASPSPSVANQLKHDWLKVLVVIGKIHGCQSTEWLHCVDIFSQLTQYSNFKQAPLALLYKVEAQLQFAGISTHELDLTVTPSPLNIDLDNRAKEGGWFEYTNGEQIIRCKLAAIIKQIGLYIFVTRHGKKILEINQDVLQAHLDSGDLVPLHTVSLNKTLEDIIKNIKQAQTAEYCEN